MGLFLSTFVNKVDKKGRISVPSQFRSALSGQSFQGIVAFKSYKRCVLEACAMDYMKRLSDSLDQLDLFSENQDDLRAVLFGQAHQLPFDGDGRIILPQSLKDFASLREEVAFVGKGATFQMWNPLHWEEHQQNATKRLREGHTMLKLAPEKSGAE